jgi:hypothetical protein
VVPAFSFTGLAAAEHGGEVLLVKIFPNHYPKNPIEELLLRKGKAIAVEVGEGHHGTDRLPDDIVINVVT